MTNKELLAEINILGKTSSINSGLANALRAIVELPIETNGDGGWEDFDAFQHGYKLAMSKVIRTIEKELK